MKLRCPFAGVIGSIFANQVTNNRLFGRKRCNMIQYRPLFLLVFLILMLCWGGAPAQAYDEKFTPIPGVQRYDGPLRVLGLEDNEDLKRSIADLAFNSRKIIRQQTSLDWRETAYILWTSEEDFQRLTNFNSEFTAAAANAAKMTIWINESAWKASSPTERQQIMTHEMGHLFVGHLSPNKRLPLWVEEGIVQHLAGEWSWTKGQNYNLGRTFDRLPPLKELEESFPQEQKARQLSYLVSYQAVENLIQEYAGKEKATIGGLLYFLQNDNARAEFLEDVWNPQNRDRWNAQISSPSRTGRIALFISTFFTEGTFWFVALFLLIAAWLKKRIERSRRNRLEREEAWRESLTDEDIVIIYGPKEGEGEPEEETPWDKHLREKEEHQNRTEDHNRRH